MNENNNNTVNKFKVVVFFCILYIASVISMIIPLRPTESVTEKRKLTKFPKISSESFWDGTYFSEIDLWFSDTFPFRDILLDGNTSVTNLYGIHSTRIYGEVADGDDIPDTPLSTESMDTSKELTTESTTDTATEAVTEEKINPDDIGMSVDVAEGDEADSALAGENLGALYVAGDTGYEYYIFGREITDRYINVINDVGNRVGSNVNVYVMVVPTSMDITLNDSVRNQLNSSNQKKAISYIYGSINNNITTVPIFDALKEHKDEYIYFRTDHHWTALGAYYSYCELMKAMGKTANALTDYKQVEYGGFTGTFYSESGKLPAIGNNPDTVIAYIPMATNDFTYTDNSGNVVNYQIVSDVTKWDGGAKYSTFIGADNPYSEIDNPLLNDGSSCVVVKESFGNAFVPFLVDHYDKIYILDYRYFNGNLLDFVSSNGIDDVIFINNIVATSTPYRINDLEAFTQ